MTTSPSEHTNNELDRAQEIVGTELYRLLDDYTKACKAVEADDTSYAHMPEWAKALLAIQAYCERQVKAAEEATWDIAYKSAVNDLTVGEQENTSEH